MSGKQLSISAITEVFSFVVSECVRVDALSKSGDRERYTQESGIHDHLPAERGEFPRGHYPCSHVAIRQLAEVAEARIAGDPALRGRIKFGTYFTPLKAELGVRCIRMREQVTAELTREVLNAAKEVAADKLTSATYFFPVFAADEYPSKERYKLGAVEFERTRQFFDRIAENWETSIAQNIEDWSAEAKARGLTLAGDSIRANYERLKGHFKEHWWMASVHVPDAEDDIGYEKAERVIDQTCTLVRLFLPSWRGSFIGVSTHRRNDANTARFMLSKKSRYDYVLSLGGSQGDTVNAAFFTQLRTMTGVADIEAVLTKLPTWAPLSEAEERLISALNWFGEAWKEDHNEAKIVKFAMCLECLLMTGAKEGLTELLSERVAFLLGTDYETRRKYFLESKQVYNARSRAVHGDSAHASLDFRRISRSAEELAGATIQAFAQLVPTLSKAAKIEAALNDFFTALKLGGIEAGRAILIKFAEMKDTGSQVRSGP